MADSGVRYEFKAVKAMRGTEGRSLSKWQKQGWELVSQDAATLHTTLNFRKVKPQLPLRQLVLGGIGVAVLLAFLGIGAALAGNGDSDDTSAAQSSPTPAAAATPEVTDEPTPDVTDEPTPEETEAGRMPVQPAEPADGPLTDITVDALLDRLNAGSSSGIKVGDRFRITGELFEEDAWGEGATGEYSVYLKAKGGSDDLLVFVDRTLATGWGNGTRVEMVVKAVEKTINGETTDGWLQAQSVKLL